MSHASSSGTSVGDVMGFGLLEALIAAVLYGLATIFQALAARAAEPSEGTGVRLLVRLVRSWRFLLGMSLDAIGFVLVLAANRQLPVFAVQAMVSASLAVTAIAATFLLGTRLGWREWAAVGVVTAGLSLLGLSAEDQGPAQADRAFHLALLLTAVTFAVLASVAHRSPRLGRPLGLASIAGLAFGVVGLAARVLDGFTPRRLFTDPATYAIVIAGIFGFVALLSALQRGSVTLSTVALVLGETLFPALVGVLLLGDRTRHGMAIPAVFGFVAAVGGALALARYGDLSADTPDAADPTNPPGARPHGSETSDTPRGAAGPGRGGLSHTHRE